MSDPRRLLDTARDLLSRADAKTAGMWPRATALLTRQALEDSLDALWRRRAPAIEQCSGRAQLLCLAAYLTSDPELARRVGYAWSGLSRACHQHAYELPPTAEELSAWLEIVDQLTTRVARH